MKDVLIKSRKKENLVPLQWPADGASDLLLTVMRFKGEKRQSGSERTVAQVVKRCAMKVIGTRLGDHIDDGTAGASLFGTIRVGRDTKLLHHFGRKLIGSAVSPASLRKKCVIVVASVDEEGIL